MSDCQEFDGYRQKRGYGIVCMGGKTVLAHRLAYALHYGVDPTGHCVMHKCDNPACVNPEHLSLGSHSDNMNDMHRKGRNKRKKYSDGVVSLIKGLIESGYNNKNIASMVGCNHKYVSAIRCGRRPNG